MNKIAIDIDNTICNTSEYYSKVAIKYDKEVLHKNSIINYNRFHPRSDEWTKEETDYYLKTIINNETINIPIKKGASLYINKLKEMGYKIIFITNRGESDYDKTDLIIPKYLKKNNIPYDKIITKTKDKYKYLNDCDYFIDDSIHNCEEALEKSNCKVILMKSNKTGDYINNNLHIVDSWKEVFNYIKKDINK